MQIKRSKEKRASYPVYMFQSQERDYQLISSHRGKVLIKKPQVNWKQEEKTKFMPKNYRQSEKKLNDYGLGSDVALQKPQTLKMNINSNKDKNVQKREEQKQSIKPKLIKNRLFAKSIQANEKMRSVDSIIKLYKSKTPRKSKNYENTKDQKQSLEASPQATIDTNDFRKTIKVLEKENEYYEGLYLNSQEEIATLKKAAKQEKKKYDRVCQIYQQKIRQMTQNRQLCQKNLGHIFSHEAASKNIVPKEIIVENSVECSSDELGIISKSGSILNESKSCLQFSCLSINSR